MAFSRIDGVLLHYALGGAADAPPVAFVNSLGTDLRIWDGVAARLEKRFRVLRHDSRGHGLSDAPPGPYRIADLAGDLLGLMDALGLNRIGLVGLSVGGLVAQEIAVQHPDRLAALVLIDTAARIGTVEGWNERIAKVEAGGLAAIGEAVVAGWFGAAFARAHPDEVAGCRQMLERMPASGYVATCAALRDTDLTGEVTRIRAPTLALAGTEDRTTTPAIVRATADRIPGARFEAIEGAGHLPCLDRPEQVAALVEAHFGESGLG